MKLIFLLVRLVKRVLQKLKNVFWYKYLFHSFGSHSSIESPVYLVHPEHIKMGHHVYISPRCRLEVHPKGRPRQPLLQIGNHVLVAHGVNISCTESLVIEDDVLISGGAFVSDNDHGTNPLMERYADQPMIAKPTKIGKGAWIGTNSCVLKGSQIGERAIIGCNSVVNGIIPPYTIAVGSPAKVVRRYCMITNRWINVAEEKTGSRQYA